MKTTIHIKSAVTGLLLGVLAVCALGASAKHGETGRYQIAVSPVGYAMVIDSQTGKVWDLSINNAQLRQTDGDFFDAKLP